MAWSPPARQRRSWLAAQAGDYVAHISHHIRDGTLLYETEDWQDFLDLETLPRKAGSQPRDLFRVVLKELVDNALDAGAEVTLDHDGNGWVVSDAGAGLDPADVPRLFSVNRPLLSSKLKRRPLRGMLGNGLRVVVGAVAATGGSLAVETRGRRLTLAVCRQTGRTDVVADDPIPARPGVTVRLALGGGRAPDPTLARLAVGVAKHGAGYDGPSSPWWYAARNLHKLFARATPADTATVGDVCRDLGVDLVEDRPARTLGLDDAAAVLARLRAAAPPPRPERLGCVGRDYLPGWPGYARTAGVSRAIQADVAIPFVVEAWATCEARRSGGRGEARLTLLFNRTPTIARIVTYTMPRGLYLDGCGLDGLVSGPGAGDYGIVLSVIAPHIQLAGDGKEPDLAPLAGTIREVLRKACTQAYRATRPARGDIKEAAWDAIPDAYRIASGGGAYPATARQVMYAARPDILAAIGASKLDDRYFTQVLLPDYIDANPRETRDWDIVYDARGTFAEPHTGHEVRIGTIGVREYLGDRPPLRPAVALTRSDRYPTRGPRHRYRAILFIEKEGFGPLFEKARIAERFDVAIMSTKGMSTTAARALLDRLAPEIAKVLVLHDLDVAGFSIFGTLGSDGRRYTFENELPVFDIGLRLADVEALGLEPEPVETKGDWSPRARTLAEHGATAAEIGFLRDRRVELNAMPADVFVGFLERKLAEHGVRKVVPERGVLEDHARRMIEQELAERELRERAAARRAAAAAVALPADLADRVRALLDRQPELPWDRAVGEVVRCLLPTRPE